jgi:hypothetical protein
MAEGCACLLGEQEGEVGSRTVPFRNDDLTNLYTLFLSSSIRLSSTARSTMLPVSWTVILVVRRSL